MKAYYHARAREYDDWWLGRGLYDGASKPGLGGGARPTLERWIAALPPTRTLDVACGTGFLTRHLPRRGRRARPERRDARGRARAGAGRELRAGRRARAALRGRRLRAPVHEPLLRPPRGGRPRSGSSPRRAASPRELVVVDAALPTAKREREWQERVLNDGTSWHGLQARSSPPTGLLAELGGGASSTRAAGSCWSPRVTRRRSSYRSLASLQRDNRALPRLRRGRLPARVAAGARGPRGQRAYIYGQAPGVVEGEERRPWRGRAGQNLRRWLELDEEAFYATFYCASVTRCYPGRSPSGSGRPTSDAARAGALLVLARVGAAPAAPGADRHRRRPRHRRLVSARGPRRMHRRDLRARRRDRGPASAPVRRRAAG